ncbi:BlaI/MecI/CopY family transcriptional regulator [Oscillospiraceae bacterium MB08-C2-2]|nr:BlaI/MecI/CopY family transcriptional regulator [Oscillospiraceae bacterium MB08-C2-2]
MYTLTEPELGIMQTLWETKEAVPRSYIQKRLSHLNWKGTTFNTYLSRLEAKNFVSKEMQGQTHYYRPLVMQQEYQQKESVSVLNKLFHGSLKNFVLSVSLTDAVSKEDLQELQTLLDDMKGGRQDGQ